MNRNRNEVGFSFCAIWSPLKKINNEAEENWSINPIWIKYPQKNALSMEKH
jgi:hypothetical protein